MNVHHESAEQITLVDTGESTMTGGRLEVAGYKWRNLCFTYGDGVADVDITALIAHHRMYGRLATVTVQPHSRYGALQFTENEGVYLVFGKSRRVMGVGLTVVFVLEPSVLDRIDVTIRLGTGPLRTLLQIASLPFSTTGLAAYGYATRSYVLAGLLGWPTGPLESLVMLSSSFGWTVVFCSPVTQVSKVVGFAVPQELGAQVWILP